MAQRLPGGVRDLVAVRGRYWAAQGIDPAALSAEALVPVLSENPLALRRPILWRSDGAVMVGYRAGQYAGL